MRRLLPLSLLVVLAGCAVAAHHRLDDLYGSPDPARYDTPASTPGARASWESARQVLDTRCVVCHACYDAPCQLKLSSYDGVARGGSKERIYALRMLAASPTRLGIDAATTAEWRSKGFHPVLNERKASPEADRAGSVMHRLLELKTKQAPETGILPADRYDFSLDRAQACPGIEEMEELEKTRPELGMPYGMPPLADAEYRTLTGWIASGAPYAAPAPLAAAQARRVAEWEAFLNGDSLKQQLMARYIYEHWYLGHLYFDDVEPREYFDLVRSTTPPGSPISVVATVRPYDDPGVERVYYRLRRVEETLVAKTHMPYALSAARLERLRALFLEPDYEVTSLPSYAVEVASNPFVAFQQLPAKARYRLMLEEAQFTIMGFIKGPVCRGQVALNVINDLFWVTFVDPELEVDELGAEAVGQALRKLHLPASEDGSLPLLKWRRYAETEREFLRAKSDFLNSAFSGHNATRLGMLWDGDGRNDNAALTIFRHFDSATVVKGLVGGEPQTAWVVGYSLLERIHYLLVAGYNPYGNVGHEVTTRMYMDFLRMEGESNFLTLLPLAARQGVRDHWYRGAGDDVKSYLQGDKAFFAQETGVKYGPGEPLPQLFAMLKKNFSRVASRRYDVSGRDLPAALRSSLARLDALEGRAVSHLPEVTFLKVKGGGAVARHYTLLHNSAHTNISTLLKENENRVPDEDTVTLVEGFLGAYPNAFHEVDAKDLPAFVDAVAALEDEPGYAALMERFGIRRSDARFWPHSDELHAAYRRSAPVEAGLFDYNRYENR